MKKKPILIAILLMHFVSYLLAQQPDSCKVLLSEISGEYAGNCKNGLADGKGIAKGVDTYKGMFKNGLPDGKGDYTYKNGNSFSGNFSHGLKHGLGKFTYYVGGKENVQKGYWSNGEYAGVSKPDENYRVTNISGIEHYSIKKMEGYENQITVSFEAVMLRNVPEDLEMTISSGEFIQENKNFSAYHYSLPVSCSISFIIRTAMSIRQCNFNFDILKPGKYIVLITNN